MIHHSLEGYYYTKKNVTYSYDWTAWKRSSATLNTNGTKGGTLTVNKSATFSGSVSGEIANIVTIGVGSTITNSSSLSWSIAANKRAHVECRAKLKVEKGTREKRKISTSNVVSTNKYTVKHIMGRNYREFKIAYE